MLRGMIRIEIVHVHPMNEIQPRRRGRTRETVLVRQHLHGMLQSLALIVSASWAQKFDSTHLKMFGSDVKHHIYLIYDRIQGAEGVCVRDVPFTVALEKVANRHLENQRRRWPRLGASCWSNVVRFMLHHISQARHLCPLNSHQ